MTAKSQVLALLVADVYEVAGLLRNHGDQLAGTAGQSQARWQLLSVVSEGDWTVPAAARRLGVSRQAIQRVADLLVADDLAYFEANPAHQRSPHLRLRPAGRAALAEITAGATQWHAAVTEHLSVPDLEHARRTLRALAAAIESQPARLR